MLISTEIPNDEERAASLAAVPWRMNVSRLFGETYGSMAGNAVDLIDASIGPANHVRAALVALHEGMEALQEATIDLAESVLRERTFSRMTPVNPLNPDEPLQPHIRKRLAIRYARFAIEDAALRVVSAGDHFVNTHLRLAWEANATTLDEIKRCGFDPERIQDPTWASVSSLYKGLLKLQDQSPGVFIQFAPNERFLSYVNNEAVSTTRDYRNQVVHRERPSYREAPSFGRTTQWARVPFSLVLPKPEEPRDEGLPTLEDRRRATGEALLQTMYYGQELWELIKQLLGTIDVWITVLGDKVEVDAKLPADPGTYPQRFPRASRDPGPFLRF